MPVDFVDRLQEDKDKRLGIVNIIDYWNSLKVRNGDHLKVTMVKK